MKSLDPHSRLLIEERKRVLVFSCVKSSPEPVGVVEAEIE